MIGSKVAISAAAILVALPLRAQPIPSSSVAGPPTTAPSTGPLHPPSPTPTSREHGPRGGSAVLVPPKAIDVLVAYPEGAQGEASVVLELMLGIDGRVMGATVISGDSPFAEAALAAAQSFRFEPASRDGRPVAARIRYTLSFHPAEPDAADPVAAATPEVPRAEQGPASARREGGAAEPSKSPPRAPPSVATTLPEPPLSMKVRGERRPAGSVTVTRNEAREMPGSFGDPLRALEAQPGVVPIVSGLPSFYVRGAPPSNVGVFIDGVDVPLLYHAFFGPSVLHPALMQSVDFYRGVSPVQYGRFAGPVISANISPFENRFGGEGSLRAIDVGAFVEMPFGRCSDDATSGCARGNARVSGRYSYTGLVLSQLSDAKLDYWDYQGQARYPLGQNGEVSVFAFGGYDFFSASSKSKSDQGARVEFHRLDARYDHAAPSGTTMRVAITGGYDRSSGTDERSSSLSDKSLRARFELATRANAPVTLRTGFDARVDSFSLNSYPLYLSFPDYSVLFPARTDFVMGGSLGAVFRVGAGITLVPGVRADMHYSMGASALGVDPRLRALFEPTPSVAIEYSIGLGHQRANFVGQVPGAQVANLDGGLQESLLSSSEVRWKLPERITASLGVFRNVYFNTLDPIGGSREFGIHRGPEERARISAYGLELGLSRSLTRKLGGFVAYTLSRSEHTSTGRTSVSGFDRPHVVQAALSYDFGRGVRAGARVIVYSGVPELKLNDPNGVPYMSAERRASAYFRLDLRLEKKWKLAKDRWITVMGEVLNSTASKEVVRLDCGDRCIERTAGPVVLPSVGAEAGF